MPKVNLLRLGRMVRDKRGDRGIREVASTIGVSPATLSRVERGKLPDLETFAKICDWLKVDPAEMLQVKTENILRVKNPRQEPEISVAAHLRADSTPEPAAAQDLAQLILAAQRAVAEGAREQ
ncbi:MAG: helix-turn-helix transcriptional regulator [Acidobacteria bacterium]|nr:helix-turn-helix transcriptional regulator [Acidobacteriota bacterium]